MAVTAGPLRTTLLLRSDPLRLFSELASAGEKISEVTLPAGRAFLVHDPDLIASLLLDRTGRIQKYLAPGVAETFGSGIFTSSGERHMSVRQTAQSLFHRVEIEEQAEVVRSIAAEAFDELVDGENDLKSFFERCTLKMVSNVLFGFDPGSRGTCLFEFAEVMQQTFQQNAVSPEAAARFAAADHGMDLLLREWLAHCVPSGGGILLPALREVTGGAEDILIQEVRSFLLASIPLSLLLATASWLLASHPSEQPALQQESASAAGLEQILQETLRLYPPGWLLIRQASAEVNLAGTSYPAGTVFLVCLWTLHRSPNLFPEPHKFRPSRWNDRADVRRGAYLPFALGSRSCLGERLSRIVARGTLPLLLKRFCLAPSARVQAPWLARITYAPSAGIWVNLTANESP